MLLILGLLDRDDILGRHSPFSTFKDMVDSLHEAEKMGAFCWIVDPLTLIWNELLDSFQQKLGYIPIDKWQDVRQLWNANVLDNATNRLVL